MSNKTTSAKQADKATAEIEQLAKRMEAIDRDWRRRAGYTGNPVHRPTYWWNMAKRLMNA